MEKENEDVKKGGQGGKGPGAPQLMFEQREQDPDQAVFAEQAILTFIRERLNDWYHDIETAVDSLEAWIVTQDQQAQGVLANRGYFDALGDGYERALLDIGGGPGRPLMGAIVREVHNTVAWAQHAESDASGFLNHMRRGVRDACWYIRDSAASVLSNEWPQLLDLAYGGSMDFVPALYRLGLPTLAFKPQELSDNLIEQSQGYVRAIQPKQQEVAQEAEPSANKESEIDQAQQQLMQDDAAKRQVAAG